MGSATLLSDAHPGNCFTLPLHHHLALPTHSARRSHLAHRHLLPGCHHEKISTSSEPLHLLPMSSSYLQLPPHTVTANLCRSCHTFIPILSLSCLWPQFSTSQFENSSQPSRPTSTKFYLEQSLCVLVNVNMYPMNKRSHHLPMASLHLQSLHCTQHAVDRTGLVHESTNESGSSSEQENH